MPSSSSTLVAIEVPDGASPGQLVQARLADGTVIQAPVPAGLKPGDTFRASVDRSQKNSTPLLGGSGGSANPSPSKMRWKVVAYVFMALMILCALRFFWLAVAHDASPATQFLMQKLRLHLVFILVACGAFLYDWSFYGPTVALQSCAAAGILSLAIVMFFGELIPALSYMIMLMASLILTAFLTLTLGPFGLIVGIILIIMVFLWAGTVTGTVLSVFGHVLYDTGDLGESLVFLFSFCILRSGMSVVQGVQAPSHWPYTTELKKDSPEFKQQSRFFMEACSKWAHKFDFQLEIMRVYRVQKPDDASDPPLFPNTGAIQLYHGTTWEAAKAIVCDGFRLPAHAGMFGKGIYFADCPLKCWRYCFASKTLSTALPKATGRGGMIFLNWVELGKIRDEKVARTELTGYDRGNWKNWLRGDRHAYDSVRGVEEEQGGSVRVPEYVIYNPKQARISYIFEVRHR
mmetsp:Transcript_28763/g.52414  ORF Transcript_28763/g.52414 Transcript_28763/m.52414 type:complete len:460 (+) Transcript_28763:53-1432(+)